MYVWLLDEEHKREMLRTVGLSTCSMRASLEHQSMPLRPKTNVWQNTNMYRNMFCELLHTSLNAFVVSRIDCISTHRDMQSSLHSPVLVALFFTHVQSCLWIPFMRGEQKLTRRAYNASRPYSTPTFQDPIAHCKYNKKDRWDSENPRLPIQSLLYPDYSGSKLLANICIPHRPPTT